MVGVDTDGIVDSFDRGVEVPCISKTCPGEELGAEHKSCMSIRSVKIDKVCRCADIETQLAGSEFRSAPKTRFVLPCIQCRHIESAVLIGICFGIQKW